MWIVRVTVVCETNLRGYKKGKAFIQHNIMYIFSNRTEFYFFGTMKGIQVKSSERGKPIFG